MHVHVHRRYTTYTRKVHPSQQNTYSVCTIIYWFTVYTSVPMLDLFHAGLTDFLHRLDNRYDERVKKDGTIMAKKHRKIGGYSNTKPPADAPEWTVDVQWKQQQGTSMAELGSAGELFGQSSPPPLAL